MAIAALPRSRRVEVAASEILAGHVPPEVAARMDGGEARGELLVLPVRTVAPDALSAGELGRGLRDGWRAVWLHDDGEVGATLDFARTPGGRPRILSYSVGRKAADLADRLRDAVAALADVPDAYRLSVLRAPAVQMEALWLLPFRPAEPSRLFGLTDPLDDDAFVAEVARRARARDAMAQQKGAAPRGTAPGP